ncbi:hypothetical protein LX69_01560 [Breznakibacter xylanolyticus]|uniref:Uncharacterized protein n=1 Tax=Breznakibacter xylanolyticus TaxID=990 RepID=A0A2W7N9Z0_9BACT|nr:hypothetical protein LX69_01560 [Breznakibacter xylanolyticus]
MKEHSNKTQKRCFTLSNRERLNRIKHLNQDKKQRRILKSEHRKTTELKYETSTSSAHRLKTQHN